MSNIDRRSFKLYDGNEKKNSDPVVNLVFTSSVPMITLPDKLISEVEIDSLEVSNNEPNNKPYDPDMDNRFTFLVKGKSVFRDTPFAIYHDAKYNDYIMMPNPDSYDLSIIPNAYLELTGYRVGYNTSNIDDGFSYVFKDFPVVNLPKGNAPVNYRVRMLNLHGLRNGYDGRVREDIGGVSIYKRVNNLAFIELDRGNVFGNDATLPLYTILPKTTVNFNLKYVSLKQPDKIYLIIPF